MSSSSFAIRPETDGDACDLVRTFGAGFRPGPVCQERLSGARRRAAGQGLSLCAVVDEQLVGGIRFTAIRIGGGEGGASARAAGGRSAVNGKGFGKALVEEGLTRAKAEGFRLVLLVGDMPYYGRFGFAAGAARADHAAGSGRSRRVCWRSSWFRARCRSAAGQVKGHAR